MNTTLLTLCRIRAFERRIERLFAEGRIGGTAHPSIGQEACAVAIAGATRRGDWVTSSHRGHGHFIALGADLGRMMAEFFGRADGYGRGRAGSQLMSDVSLGFLGANGITAGSLPLATGAAFAFRRRGENRVVFAVFGDGSSSQGVFHESLNIAALWGLPVVFVCENNGYGMSTPTASAVALGSVLPKAAGYGITAMSADGNDIDAATAVLREARATALARGPVLVELSTYRLCGHSKGDPRVYRTREEEAEAAKRDPIPRYAAKLGLGERELSEAFAAAEAEVDAAVAFAEASPPPEPETATAGVFADMSEEGSRQ